MAPATASLFKPASLSDLPAFRLPFVPIFGKSLHTLLPIPPKPIKLQLSYAHFHQASSLEPRKTKIFFSIVNSVGQAPDWAQKEEVSDISDGLVISEGEEEAASEEDFTWEKLDPDNTLDRLSDWEAEGEDSAIAAGGDEFVEGEEEVEEGVEGGYEDGAEEGHEEGLEVEGVEEGAEGGYEVGAKGGVVEGFEEEGVEEGTERGVEVEDVQEVEEDDSVLPEETKVFVGNLAYDVDSEGLAQIFNQAGTVEISEVIYNRETDQSRGFGFVTMSTVEEAEKAVEMFDRYELSGRLLTVNKAAPRGSRLERPPRVFQPAFKIYVGNLPWDVDSTRLENIFGNHGKVIDARVVLDRDTGRSRGFGFVTMSTETEMESAVSALDGQSLGGRTLRVNVAEERPRRSSFSMG